MNATKSSRKSQIVKDDCLYAKQNGHILTLINEPGSLFASIIFHFFVNPMQEKIAITNTTKCVETLVLFIAAFIVVVLNKDLFFEKRHIGNLLGAAKK